MRKKLGAVVGLQAGQCDAISKELDGLPTTANTAITMHLSMCAEILP